MQVRELAEAIHLVLDDTFDYSAIYTPNGVVPEQSPGQSKCEMQPRVIGLYAEDKVGDDKTPGGRRPDIFIPLSAIIESPDICTLSPDVAHCIFAV